MTDCKVELFYYPVFKGFAEPTNIEMEQKITRYPKYHPGLSPKEDETWCCFKMLPNFHHNTIACDIIVAPKPLKEPNSSDGKTCLFRCGIA